MLWALLPVWVSAQQLDAGHILIDAEAAAGVPYVYRSFQDAAARMAAGDVTVYVRPGVYWIDDPDDPAVRVGKDGREPFGMVIAAPPASRLRLVGLGDSPHDVVLASQRGQTQGAIGNFTMFDIRCGTLEVENLTMGNYCNVDLVYPRNPRLNRPKRNATITQAHVGYVHADTLVARRVRFVSRLNLNPLNGARHSYYEACHFECTDDALNGNATYRRCDFDFYGSKPWWSTHGAGALLIDCDFYARSDNRETYFCKQGGPLTLVNCRYHASSDSIYIGWTAYPQPWLRCYQQDFTLNGRPYVVGHRQPQHTLRYAVLTPDSIRPPYLAISSYEAKGVTGRDTVRLTVAEPVKWVVEQGYESFVTLVPSAQECIVIPANNTDETARFCIEAHTADGRVAACQLTALPVPLPPPAFVRLPRIRRGADSLSVDYQLDLHGRRDESRITWYRNGIPVAVSHRAPERTYHLSAADHGTVAVTVEPKHQRSTYGTAERAAFTVGRAPVSRVLTTDFHDFPCQWQPEVREGFWTVDGYKPLDTADFPWSFDVARPMWEYKEGYNGAVGWGLLQAQRGARLMYTPVARAYGDMSVRLEVDPTKTAGQGFGSATGQYMDVCLKFDTRTLTGYGLRIIRTTKHAKAVDFLLVRYDHGRVTPLTAPVTATCYRTGCSISVDFNGKTLSARVSTQTPRPAGSALAHEVELAAEVEPSAAGGVHIQHTGSCGESTTMLHRLSVDWR